MAQLKLVYWEGVMNWNSEDGWQYRFDAPREDIIHMDVEVGTPYGNQAQVKISAVVVEPAEDVVD